MSVSGTPSCRAYTGTLYPVGAGSVDDTDTTAEIKVPFPTFLPAPGRGWVLSPGVREVPWLWGEDGPVVWGEGGPTVLE